MAIILPILYKDDPKGLRKAERSLQNFAKNVGRATAVGFGVAGLAAGKFAFDSVKAFAEAEASQAKLAFAFEKFPKLADTNVAALQKLNTQLAKKTRFDDDAIAVGQATLAQYKLTGKQIARLTPLVADYAARTGRSFEDSAQIIGKAMLGQGRALKDVGVNFKDTGTLAGNFEQVVGKLGKAVGGFAQKDVLTASGKLENLKNRFGELQEQIGAALLPDLIDLMTFFETSVLPKLQRVADFIQEKLVPAFKQFKDFVVQNKDVIGPLAAVFAVLAGAITLVIAAFAAPIATAMIAQVVFLGVYIANAIVLFDALKKNAGKVFDFIGLAFKLTAITFQQTILNLVGSLASFLQNTVNAVIKVALNPLIAKLNEILGFLGVKKLSLLATVDFTSNIQKAQDALTGQDRTARGQGGGTPPRRMARGGLVTGPQRVLIGEGGPEVVAPYDQFIKTLGMSSAGGSASSTYNVTVNAGMGTDGVSVGREIVKAIKRYERASGPVFAGA
jgi:uncharacterized protein YjbJ (UPF0337 family)